MIIESKFDLGGYAYLKAKALEGILSRVKIINIETESESNTTGVRYLVYGVDAFNETWYLEEQLYSMPEAKTAILNYLDQLRASALEQEEIVAGQFEPVKSTIEILS